MALTSVTAAFGTWGLAVLSSAPRERNTPLPLQIAPDVIDACRRGDRTALDVVFRAHAEVLERLLVRLVGPKADVEDLLQETFATAIQAFPHFRGEASVRTWLHRIAVHVAYRHLRQPRHRRDVPLEEESVDVSHEPTLGDALDSHALAQRLYEHLEAIDPQKRIALVLHAFEGRPISEVAALIGASRAATKARIFLARRTLRKRLLRDPLFTDRGGSL